MANNATKKCPYCAEDILVAAVKCKHCGSSLDSVPAASSRSGETPKQAAKQLLGIIIVCGLGLWVFNRCSAPDEPRVEPPKITFNTSPNPAPSEPTAPQAPVIVLPVTEFKLIDIVSTAQRESVGAANDMQRGGFKNKRDKALCALMTKMQVNGWVGKIDDISANSDGKGVLSIALDTDILVETYNNEFSDGLSGDKTLMDPNSPLFVKVSSLKKGDTVRFSGTFFRSHGDAEDASDCLEEMSLTLKGKLSKPEFIFRFASVDPIT